MKQLILIFALALVSANLAAASINEAVFLRSTALVESPGGDRRGRAGERTPYQILPATWRRHSAIPMATAPAAEVERVARCILREIRGELRRQGLPETPHNYALRWNAGAWAKYFKIATWDYACRVENLYAND